MKDAERGVTRLVVYVCAHGKQHATRSLAISCKTCKETARKSAATTRALTAEQKRDLFLSRVCDGESYASIARRMERSSGRIQQVYAKMLRTANKTLRLENYSTVDFTFLYNKENVSRAMAEDFFNTYIAQ